jgi:hypothetical protein
MTSLMATEAAEDREAPPEAVMHLQALTSAPGVFRWYLESTLGLWHMDSLNETAALVLSEISTNAVAAVRQWQDGHSGVRIDPTITAVFRKVRADALRIEVWDRCPVQPLPPLAGNLPDIDDEHGRGLFLVDQLSSAWGTSRADSGGKYVWALLVA